VTAEEPSGTRLSPTRLLQLTTFTSTLDRFAMPPLLIAIALDMGVPLSQVVQAAGAYFLAYGLMQPVWGIVSDSLGLVRTMRLTLLLAAVATIASAFVWTPLALGIGRAVAGGLFGAAYPASLIYIGDTVPAQRRQREVTQLMVGVAVGTALASLGAGLLAHLLTWRATFLVTGVAALVLVLLLRNLPEPPRTRSHVHLLSPVGHVLRSRAAVLVLVLAFVEGAVLLGVLTLLPAAVEAEGTTAAIAGTVAGTYGISVYLSARLVGRLSRSQHPSRLIALGATSALAACGILAVSRSPLVAVLVAALLGLGWASMHSSLQTWATEVMPAARATVVSLFAGSLFVGSAVAAVVVADLAEADEYRTIFLCAAATALPLGLLATWGRARWRRPDEQTT
jgi:predicted MFS family arabinose efflux permease